MSSALSFTSFFVFTSFFTEEETLSIFKKKSFTIPDVIDNVIEEAHKLKYQLRQEELGELEKNIGVCVTIKKLTSGKKISRSKLEASLDQFDNGLSRSNPKEHPYAVPLVNTKADYLFALLIVKCLDGILKHQEKLDLTQYNSFARFFMRLGLNMLLGPRGQHLFQRIDEYEQNMRPDYSNPQHRRLFLNQFYLPQNTSSLQVDNSHIVTRTARKTISNHF